MTRLRSLIKEVLSQPKKKDCGCGCNDCGGKAPILTEGKFKPLISEGLQHHIDKKISLFESVYRIGSEKHLELIREARALWIRGIIEVSDDDKGLLETHLGHFGLYEGVEVPLDLPMVNEEVEIEKSIKDIEDGDVILLGKNKRFKVDYIDPWSAGGRILNGTDLKSGKKGQLKVKFLTPKGSTGTASDTMLTVLKKSVNEGPIDRVIGGRPYEYVGDGRKGKAIVSGPMKDREKGDIIKRAEKAGYIAKPNMGGGVTIFIESLNENNLLRQTNLSSEEYQKAKKLKGFNADDYTFSSDNNLYVKKSSLEERINTILEAKKKAKSKKKDPPLNKPKRGGSKAYYVYVRDPKTKKIKKVSFGSGGLRAKIKNKEARNAFAARHNCKNKKDRTKAGYWSCNLPRYADQLGLGSKMNTFW